MRALTDDHWQENLLSEVVITFNLSVPSINRYLLLMATDENGGVTLPAGYDGIGGAMAHSLLRVCFNTMFHGVSTQCFKMVFQHQHICIHSY
jgi:hypothetical protein